MFPRRLLVKVAILIIQKMVSWGLSFWKASDNNVEKQTTLITSSLSPRMEQCIWFLETHPDAPKQKWLPTAKASTIEKLTRNNWSTLRKGPDKKKQND